MAVLAIYLSIPCISKNLGKVFVEIPPYFDKQKWLHHSRGIPVVGYFYSILKVVLFPAFE